MKEARLEAKGKIMKENKLGSEGEDHEEIRQHDQGDPKDEGDMVGKNEEHGVRQSKRKRRPPKVWRSSQTITKTILAASALMGIIIGIYPNMDHKQLSASHSTGLLFPIESVKVDENEMIKTLDDNRKHENVKAVDLKLEEMSLLVGDNSYVVVDNTLPSSSIINKGAHAFIYHGVRNAMLKAVLNLGIQIRGQCCKHIYEDEVLKTTIGATES